MAFLKITKGEIENIIEDIRKSIPNRCKICDSEVRVGSTDATQDIGRCAWTPCRSRWNRWQGTIFENMKIPKPKALKIMQLWIFKFSTNQIAFSCMLTRKTVSKLLKKVAIFLDMHNHNHLKEIGGKEIVIEIDESAFSKRKYNRGRLVKTQWVLGMVEKTPKRKIILLAVEDRKAATLEGLISKYVHCESIIHTDGWKGYSALNENFESHKTVNHSKNFVDPLTGCHTNTIEGNWTGVKLNVPYKSRKREKIDLYLARYMILRNSDGHPFYEILKYFF